MGCALAAKPLYALGVSMNNLIQNFLDVLKNISPFISYSMLLVYGFSIIYLFKKYLKLKEEKYLISKEINLLKDEKIEILRDQIGELQKKGIDPNDLLAQSNIIRMAADEKVSLAKAKLEEALLQLEEKSNEYIEIKKAYDNLLSEQQNAQNQIKNINEEHSKNETIKLRNTYNRQLQIITHEIMSPIVGIQAHSSLLLDYWDKLEDKKIKMKLEDILESTNLISMLLDSLRDVETVELNNTYSNLYKDVLLYCIHILDQEFKINQIKYEIRKQIEIPNMYYDSLLFKRIVYNILSNSLKYTKVNGEIIIAFSDDTENYYLDFSNYNGFGILQNESQKIFSKYYRGTNIRNIYPTGLGLGLYYAKYLANIMGADLQLTNLNEPTNFRLILPKVKFIGKER